MGQGDAGLVSKTAQTWRPSCVKSTTEERKDGFYYSVHKRASLSLRLSILADKSSGFHGLFIKYNEADQELKFKVIYLLNDGT